MSREVLRAEGLQKSYRTGSERLTVLQGIDLTVRLGESVAIVGQSGSGKSTLLHLLGLLDTPDEGHLLLDGTDVAHLGASARARLRNTRFGFVFQFYHLLPELTALENVYLPAMIEAGTFGWLRGRRAIKRRAAGLLDQVGLADRAKHKPKQLSGGERQRVAIARALINSPEILLCDEPTGNLDAKTNRSVTKLLWRLKKELNQTLLIVTHEPNLAAAADRRLLLVDGKICKSDE